MASFDFITDEQFRASLESDYKELEASLTAKAWKGVHVLAGSIVEAVMADYLLEIDYYSKQKARNPSARDRDIQPLEMTLGQLIEACNSEGILSQRSVALSTVVKDYRNLIHPGRVKRLQEIVDESGATVAKGLTEMIVRDISNKRQEAFGATAAQIVRKVLQDPSSVAFIDHLLRDMAPSELERLVVDELPDAYVENLSVARQVGHDTTGVDALRPTFQAALDRVADDVKAKVAKRFVTILKEESQQTILDYEQAFFRASALFYLTDDEKALVKQHLLSSLQHVTIPPQALNVMLDDLGRHIDSKAQAEQLGDLLVQYLVAKYGHFSEGTADTILSQLYWEIEPPFDNDFTESAIKTLNAQRSNARMLEVAEWIDKVQTSFKSTTENPFL